LPPLFFAVAWRAPEVDLRGGLSTFMAYPLLGVGTPLICSRSQRHWIYQFAAGLSLCREQMNLRNQVSHIAITETTWQFRLQFRLQ
jgi:hypothetical protein